MLIRNTVVALFSLLAVGTPKPTDRLASAAEPGNVPTSAGSLSRYFTGGSFVFPPAYRAGMAPLAAAFPAETCGFTPEQYSPIDSNVYVFEDQADWGRFHMEWQLLLSCYLDLHLYDNTDNPWHTAIESLTSLGPTEDFWIYTNWYTDNQYPTPPGGNRTYGWTIQSQGGGSLHSETFVVLGADLGGDDLDQVEGVDWTFDGDTPTFTWDAVSGADSYKVFLMCGAMLGWYLQPWATVNDEEWESAADADNQTIEGQPARTWGYEWVAVSIVAHGAAGDGPPSTPVFIRTDGNWCESPALASRPLAKAGKAGPGVGTPTKVAARAGRPTPRATMRSTTSR